MTTWNAARDALATKLAAVTITSPISASIKKVYKYRPDGETDFPCVVLASPPAKRVERGPSGLRDKYYDVTMQLLVRDADVDRAAEILDAFEEAIIDAIDDAVTLGLFSGYHVTRGPDWDAAGYVALSDSTLATAATGVLSLRMKDAKNFIG